MDVLLERSDLSPAHAHTFHNFFKIYSGRSVWNISGEGETIDVWEKGNKPCGAPFIKGSDGHLVVWAPHRCNRRECPVCVDYGFMKSSVNRQLREIQAKICHLILEGKGRKKVDVVQRSKDGSVIYDENGDRVYKKMMKRLKAYHVIVSLEEGDHAENRTILSRKRGKAISILKKSGIVWGLLSVHPYRGPKGLSGAERRSNLDRSCESLHFHCIGLGYWVEDHLDGRDGDHIVKVPEGSRKGSPSGVLGTIQYKPEAVGKLWGRISKALKYELDHSGWMGNGQMSSRFGKQIKTDQCDLRPDPEMYFNIRIDGANETDGSLYELAGSQFYANDWVLLQEERWLINCLFKKKAPPRHGKMLEDIRFRFFHIDDPQVELILDDQWGIQWDKDLAYAMSKKHW